MKKILSGGYYKIFLIRILFVFFLLSFTRILFFVFNHKYFQELSFWEFLPLLFYGLRFDFSAITAFFSIFIFLSIIPFNLRYKAYYQKILLVFYVLSTIIIIMCNLLDFEFFKFTLARTTSDIFNVLGLGSDLSSLLTQYIKDFWYLFLIWFVLIFITIKFFLKTKIVINKNKTSLKPLYQYVKDTFVFIACIIISIIGFRGGFQLRPISIITASQYTSVNNVAIVLNTPFTIIKTIGKSGVKNIEYFDEKTLNSIFNPIHLYSPDNKSFKKQNVVIIILEGFSKEYFGKLNTDIDSGDYKGYTPFLDSLIDESLVFTNAYSNGKRSIEGIPAVLAGIPTLMSDAYITSMYSGNNINSIASLLKNNGYFSAFFHGGTNGTMGFDNFAKTAGFDKYFGRSEYNNEKDFDGKWGISDEEFLQYVANQFDKFSKPFVAGIFTLSSHHPYKIPEKYASKFSKGNLPIHQSIMYTDFALKRFFQKMSKMSWFDSTLFVITADHTSELVYSKYQTRLGMYAIPIIYYQHNSSLKGKSALITQQIDIMPSVLDYLHYDKFFFSFGESVFDTTAIHFAINYTNETYQLVNKKFSLIFDGASTISLYNIVNDDLLKTNLKNDSVLIKNEFEKKIKAIIQSYNQRMIKNKMVLK